MSFRIERSYSRPQNFSFIESLTPNLGEPGSDPPKGTFLFGTTRFWALIGIDYRDAVRTGAALP